MAIFSSEQEFMLVYVTAGVTVNTLLGIVRSITRRKEAEERRQEIRERRAFQTWLHEHGIEERAATIELKEAVREFGRKHDELAEAVRNVTPIGLLPVGKK